MLAGLPEHPRVRANQADAGRSGREAPGLAEWCSLERASGGEQAETSPSSSLVRALLLSMSRDHFHLGGGVQDRKEVLPASCDLVLP